MRGTYPTADRSGPVARAGLLSGAVAGAATGMLAGGAADTVIGSAVGALVGLAVGVVVQVTDAPRDPHAGTGPVLGRVPIQRRHDDSRGG